MPQSRWTVIPGAAPLVLVAPHGGRRDPERRPWSAGHLKVNDLETAALTAELAALARAPALVNADTDRNDVDLNRISETHELAPDFLAQLRALVGQTMTTHGRATVLTIHGWNVIQPAVDVGVGVAPGADPLVVGARAAASQTFVSHAVRRLLEACAVRGIAATVGARYPARHRENLLQLFTPRYRDDPRPAVRALAELAPRVDALQLELGIPLRWPGPWRRLLLDAFRDALPALASPVAAASPGSARAPGASTPPEPCRLEFTSPDLCGLVGVEAGGTGRMLLFGPEGGLVLFTGELLGRSGPGMGSGLGVATGASGVTIRYEGPMARFPDTTPFLDLEAGLARAELVSASIDLRLDAAEPDAPSPRSGRVAGHARIDDVTRAITGHGFTGGNGQPASWPRVRVALRLDDVTTLTVAVPLAGGRASGSLVRDGRRIPVTNGRVELGPEATPLARLTLAVELGNGESLALTAHAVHRLPVIRVRGGAALRLEFAACRLANATTPAGWCEVAGF